MALGCVRAVHVLPRAAPKGVGMGLVYACWLGLGGVDARTLPRLLGCGPKGVAVNGLLGSREPLRAWRGLPLALVPGRAVRRLAGPWGPL